VHTVIAAFYYLCVFDLTLFDMDITVAL